MGRGEAEASVSTSFLTSTQTKRIGVIKLILKRGTTDPHSHSQAHHRVPIAMQLATTGIPFEEVMPKYGHETFPCEGSREGIWGLSTRIWGGRQPYKLAVSHRMLAQLISNCCLQ